MHGSSGNGTEQKEPELVLDESRPITLTTKQVAVGAILGALSVAIAPLAGFLPRLSWGMAIFDPVSFVWIIAFLLGGIWVGLISLVAGTIALFMFDPTVIGPFYKFAATLPFIVVPYIGVRLRKCDGASLSSPRFYSLLMLAAYVVRITVMVPVNLLTIGGPLDVILTVTIVVNSIQSILDAIVPFLVVHRTPVFRNFRLW